MKKLLPLFLFLFLIPSALALYGGEKLTYNIESCNSLNVTIEPYQMYEWSATPNCSNHKSGKWICNCTDNWDIILTPKYNCVGTFDILIEYSYLAPEPVKETAQISYPSSGGRIRYKDIVLNLTKTIERTLYINDTVECENVTVIKYVNQTVVQEKPLTLWDKVIDVLGYLMLILLIIIIILGILLFELFKK